MVDQICFSDVVLRDYIQMTKFAGDCLHEGHYPTSGIKKRMITA